MRRPALLWGMMLILTVAFAMGFGGVLWNVRVLSTYPVDLEVLSGPPPASDGDRAQSVRLQARIPSARRAFLRQGDVARLAIDKWDLRADVTDAVTTDKGSLITLRASDQGRALDLLEYARDRTNQGLRLSGSLTIRHLRLINVILR